MTEHIFTKNAILDGMSVTNAQNIYCTKSVNIVSELYKNIKIFLYFTA